MSIVIIDYGSGNLRSAEKAFARMGKGRDVVVTSDPSALAKAAHIVLPGVGSFGDCAAGLNAIDGIECPAPDGAFYVFADISGLIGRTRPDGTVIETDSDFAAALLELGEVAIVPGVAFGLSPAFRLSFAAADDALDEALGRIATVVASLT